MSDSVMRYGGRATKKKRIHKQPFDLTEFTATLLCLLFISNNATVMNKHKRKAKEFIDAIDIAEYRNDGNTHNKLILASIMGKCVVEFNYENYSAIKQKALEYTDYYDEFLLFFEDFENDNGFIIDGDLLNSELSNELVKFIDEYVSSRLQYYFLWKVSNSLRDISDTIDSGELGNIDTFVEDASSTVEEFLFAAKKSKSLTQYEISDFSTGDDSLFEAVKYASDLAKRPSNKIKTGVKYLNSVLAGGYEGGRTYVYFAPSGGWKSGILVSSALWAIDANFNNEYKLKDPTKEPCVLYLSAENDRNETIGRMISFLLGSHHDLETTPTDELLELFDDALNSGSAHFEFKFRPSRSINTNDVRSMVDDLAIEGKEVVLLVVDYIKRIRPVESSEHRHLELGAVVDELSMIAKEFMIPVVTANQLNREAYSKLATEIEKNNFDGIKKVNESNAGESINVIENADNAIFLNSLDFPELNQRHLSINGVKRRGKGTNKISFFHQPFAHDANNEINGMKLVEDANADMSDIAGSLELSTKLGSNYNPNNPTGSGTSPTPSQQPVRSKKGSKAALIQSSLVNKPTPTSLVTKLNTDSSDNTNVTVQAPKIIDKDSSPEDLIDNLFDD